MSVPLDPENRTAKIPDMDSFKDLHATQLYCDRCKIAVPVREKLLLVIPGKNLYEYLCTRCGQSLGKRTEPDANNMNINIIDPHRQSGK